MVTLWGALAGGFIGTLVLTTVLRAASELRMTRLDLPFLLGTMVTADRLRAKALGYLFHFFFGLFFARPVQRERPGQRPPSRRPSPDGKLAQQHPFQDPPRTAGLHDVQLRPRAPLVSLGAHIAYGTLVGGIAALGR
jgi:hypothetical protein